MIQIVPKKKDRFGESNNSWGLFIHETEVLTQEAKFAMSLLERWGMIQGVDGGEDTAGRAKINLMPVEECIDRAVLMSEKVFGKIREKKWFVEVSSIEEIEKELFTDE